MATYPVHKLSKAEFLALVEKIGGHTSKTSDAIQVEFQLCDTLRSGSVMVNARTLRHGQYCSPDKYDHVIISSAEMIVSGALDAKTAARLFGEMVETV